MYLYIIEWRGLAQKVEHNLRVSAYDHAQRLELNWHEKQTTGNITAILNDDVNQLERFLNNGVNQIIQVTISTIIIGFIFFYISPLIAAIAVLPVPIIFLISIFFQKKLSPRYTKIREKVGFLNSSIIINLIGIQTIKSFMTFNREKERIDSISEEYQTENIIDKKNIGPEVFLDLYNLKQTYYLLSHKDKSMISTNNPVTPPNRNEPTRAEILAITSVPNQPLPNTTVDRIETDTNPVNTPDIPPNTSPIVPKIDLKFIVNLLHCYCLLE